MGDLTLPKFGDSKFPITTNLPPSTINDWFSDVSDLLRPLYFQIRELVMECDYIQADETTVPIVDDEKHKTVKGYLW